MELTKNQKLVGVGLVGATAVLLYKNRVKLQSLRSTTAAGLPSQVVVPVPSAPILNAISRVAGDELVNRALNQTPIVIQGGQAAPIHIETMNDVQKALNLLHLCAAVPVNGTLDDATRACISTFQTLNNLPVTGQNDDATRHALETAVMRAGASNIAPPVATHPAVTSPSSRHAQIVSDRDVQRALNLLGASPKLVEDGKIGNATTAALKAFQVTHALLADGLASPSTKAALAVALSGAIKPPPLPAPPATPSVAGEFGTEFGIAAGMLRRPAPPPMARRGDRRGDWRYPGQVIIVAPEEDDEDDGEPGLDAGYESPEERIRIEEERRRREEEMRFHLHSPRPEGPGRRPAGPQMNTWERWQEMHPFTTYQDYLNWWGQYGSQGAVINGEGWERRAEEHDGERFDESRRRREEQHRRRMGLVGHAEDINEAIASIPVGPMFIDRPLGWFEERHDGGHDERRWRHPLERPAAPSGIPSGASAPMPPPPGAPHVPTPSGPGVPLPPGPTAHIPAPPGHPAPPAGPGVPLPPR
jgi:peptidoglycan hydrolase-like protein with peptidoglycan-binding domain